MNKIANSILMFGGSALVAAMLTNAAVSNAAFIQNRGVSACMPVLGSTSSLREGSMGLHTTGTNDVEVLCDVTTDNLRPAWAVTTLFVTGNDTSLTQATKFHACRRYSTMAGGACGPQASNGPVSAMGMYQIPIDLTQWLLAGTGDWAYIDVILAKNSGGVNYLSGFHLYYP